MVNALCLFKHKYIQFNAIRIFNTCCGSEWLHHFAAKPKVGSRVMLQSSALTSEVASVQRQTSQGTQTFARIGQKHQLTHVCGIRAPLQRSQFAISRAHWLLAAGTRSKVLKYSLSLLWHFLSRVRLFPYCRVFGTCEQNTFRYSSGSRWQTSRHCTGALPPLELWL